MTDLRAKPLAVASLLLMAMLWGSTFVVAKDTLLRMPAPDMLAVRYTIALAVLAALAWRSFRMPARMFLQGLVLGALFTFGQLAQTVGLASTHASVSGFLTGTYVLFTPLLARVVFGTRIRRNIWMAIGLAIVGLGVLSIVPGEGGASFGMGETLTLVGAVAFAGHIIATGRFVTPRNAMSLTLVQTSVMVVVAWAIALPGGVTLPGTLADWVAILYLAIIAGSATLFLQNWAQAYIDATRAAVIMCSEPVWAAFFAVALGTEPLTWQMVTGGAAIIGAMYLVVGRLPRIRVRTIVGLATRRNSGVDHLAGALSRGRVFHREGGAEAQLRQGA